MKITITGLAFAMLLAGCSQQSHEPVQQATSARVTPVVMSVDATAACNNAGGQLAFSRHLDGTSEGMCQLANGRRCSERALEMGSCAR
ncbi:MAG: hypothetical protein XXXJIFNMEKO3_01399 [Candidatus Erwinia impunctatus]|nr:hypothetical protein XXXJIFNMEKO_01399 [Culicoides impunctatus]